MKRLPDARMPNVELAVILAHWLPPMPVMVAAEQRLDLMPLLPLPHIVEVALLLVKQLRLPSMSPPGIVSPLAAAYSSSWVCSSPISSRNS